MGLTLREILKEKREKQQDKVETCCHCGKKITCNEKIIKVRTCDVFNDVEEFYWCEDCYKDFMGDIGDKL